jgi:PST family polysaccharide transporter
MYSLFVLQGVNYILPLFLISYLIRTLGVDNYGLLAFCMATTALFQGVVSYGFELTATKDIALAKNSTTCISDIFSRVIYTKAVLIIFCIVVLTVMISLIPIINQNSELFLVAFLIVLVDAFFPTWLFQGMEDMKIITKLRIVFKVVTFLLVILLVNKEEDYLLVPLIEGGVGIFVSGFAMYLSIKRYNLSIEMPDWIKIKSELLNGRFIFLSQIAVYFYTSFNVFILGLLFQTQTVGYYSLAEKIYASIRGLLKPINQAVYPYLSKKYEDDVYEYRYFTKKLSQVYFFSLSIFSAITFLFSPEIIFIVSGKELVEASNILNVFSITLLFGIGGLFSSLLVIKSQTKKLLKITFLTTILNISLAYPIALTFGVIGMSYLYLVSQIFQFLLQIYFNKDIWIKRTLEGS